MQINSSNRHKKNDPTPPDDSMRVEGSDDTVMRRTDALKKYERLKKELDQCKIERKEYLDGWQRARADYMNLKKSLNEERKRTFEFAASELIQNFLPIADSLIFALRESEKKDENGVWTQGIKQVYSQFASILKEHGYELFDDMHQPFNPLRHHSCGTIPVSDKKLDGAIVEVLQMGCVKGDTVIRPATVKVGHYSE